MSAAINTGGPAFPVEFDHQTFAPRTVEEAKRLMSGMTLRDYFAARASEEDINAAARDIKTVETILRNPVTGYCDVTRRRPENWRQIARYMHADAMLAARQGGAA